MTQITKLELQIKALEKNYESAISNPKPTVNIFALNNLIKKKRKLLEDLKQYEWLAR